MDEGKTNEELVALYQGGDQDTLLELWNKNQGFIGHMARKLSAYAEEEDLLQEAFFGLRSAADLYDPEKGVQFMSYAGYWIRQAMGRYIEKCGAIVRLPAGAKQQLRRIKKAEEKFYNMAGREPDDAEICALLQITKSQLQDLKKAAKVEQCRSLAELLPGEEDITLGDTIPDESSLEEDAIRRLDQERLASLLQEELQKLPEDQQEALHAKFWGQVEEFTTEEKNALKRAKRSLQKAGVRRKLEPYFRAEHYIPRHVGVSYFQSTGLSEPLLAVIRAEDAAERYAGKQERILWSN